MTQESEDFELFKDFWETGKGEEGHLTVSNLLILLCVVRGICLEIHTSQEDAEAKIVFDGDGKMFIKRGAHQILFLHFKSLYVNYLEFQGKNNTISSKTRKAPVAVARIDLQVKPKISPASDEIARRQREKLAGQDQ